MADIDKKVAQPNDIAIEEAAEKHMTGDYMDITSKDKALNLLANRHVHFDPNSPEAKPVKWKINA
ncbi:hypothetical protein BDW59DRAFT_167520 [Aspergillus cavernicola]|uniref:Uncharacterized protein n=1 Tax=Aspergillus cavernicola TaxID=176166 RepID=A0ABR4HDC3_9EURO